MKKAMFLLLLVILLSGCTHTHTAGGWEVNAAEHWKTCECGEAYEVGEHTLDDANRCTGCGAEVLAGEESTEVSMFNEKGDVIACDVYDAEGKITLSVRNEYIYDDSGNVRSVIRYENGVLVKESVFTDGKLDTCISHFEDGACQVDLFDENGNIVSQVGYDAEDQMTYGIYSEYALDADENWYEVRGTTVDTSGTQYVIEYNEMGDETAVTVLDPDGNMTRCERYEITYTDSGNHDTRKTYFGETLIREEIYLFVTDAHGWANFPGTIIDYHEDGTKTVTTFDETGAQVSQVHYDAEGREETP